VIRLTVETGTLTAVAATIDLIFFLTVHNGLHQVSGVILGKLYTNTLLVIFNNRMIMVNKGLYQSDVVSALGFNLPPGMTGTTDVEVGGSAMALTDTQFSERYPSALASVEGGK
jgi:hypothetical protein